MKRKQITWLITIAIVTQVICIGGCKAMLGKHGHPFYYKAVNNSDGSRYRCDFYALDGKNIIDTKKCKTVLTKKHNNKKQFVELSGSVFQITISPDGKLIGLLTSDEADYKRLNTSEIDKVTILDTRSMNVLSAWHLSSARWKSQLCEDISYLPDAIDINYGKSQFALVARTMCDKKRMWTVNIADLMSGKLLHEMVVPETVPIYQVIDLKFSTDDRYIALYSGYVECSKPKWLAWTPFVYRKFYTSLIIWRTEDGSVVKMIKDIPHRQPWFKCKFKGEQYRPAYVDKPLLIHWIARDGQPGVVLPEGDECFID